MCMSYFITQKRKEVEENIYISLKGLLGCHTCRVDVADVVKSEIYVKNVST